MYTAINYMRKDKKDKDNYLSLPSRVEEGSKYLGSFPSFSLGLLMTFP